MNFDDLFTVKTICNENIKEERRKTITITEHDLKLLINGITKNITEDLKKDLKNDLKNDKNFYTNRNGFHISDEEHYKQHLALQEILTLTNNVKNSFLKYMLGLLFIIAILVIGISEKFGIR